MVRHFPYHAPDNMLFILDADGRTPICVTDPIEWARWRGGSNPVLAQTEIPGGVVSTVFLCLNMRILPLDAPPHLWETMVFIDGQSADVARYSTYADAERGHEKMVEAWSRGKTS